MLSLIRLVELIVLLTNLNTNQVSQQTKNIMKVVVGLKYLDKKKGLIMKK